MNVRTMTLDDLDAALALWARTEHLGSVPRAEVERLLAHDDGLVLVATDDAGVLVGAVLGSYDGRRGWINRLAVDRSARRAGVGRGLVAELERRLEARGCRQVNLLVFDANDAGRQVWRTLGYAETPEVVLFSRRLAVADADADAC